MSAEFGDKGNNNIILSLKEGGSSAPQKPTQPANPNQNQVPATVDFATELEKRGIQFKGVTSERPKR